MDISQPAFCREQLCHKSHRNCLKDTKNRKNKCNPTSLFTCISKRLSELGSYAPVKKEGRPASIHNKKKYKTFFFFAVQSQGEITGTCAVLGCRLFNIFLYHLGEKKKKKSLHMETEEDTAILRTHKVRIPVKN